MAPPGEANPAVMEDAPSSPVAMWMGDETPCKLAGEPADMSATPFMQGDNIALLTPPTVAHSGSWEESLQGWVEAARVNGEATLGTITNVAVNESSRAAEVCSATASSLDSPDRVPSMSLNPHYGRPPPTARASPGDKQPPPTPARTPRGRRGPSLALHIPLGPIGHSPRRSAAGRSAKPEIPQLSRAWDASSVTPRQSLDGGLFTPVDTPSRASTPRTPVEATDPRVLGSAPEDFGPRGAAITCPASPKAFRSKPLPANSALNERRVLVHTGLKQSSSFQMPGTFRFNDHFRFLGMIGRSTFSIVYKVQHHATGEHYAVKVLTRKLVSRADRERALREVKVVADLPEHPNVVSYYRGWQEGRQLHIQMEYCARGTLAALVHRWQASRQIPPEVEVWRVARDVAGTLAFIHAHGIVHLDVKPENVFLGENTFKLGDFGLAIRLGSGGRQDWEEGDGHYVAPELLASDTGLPTAAADLYSLGATLFECVTGARVPRSGRGSCALDQPVWDHFSAALRQLVQALLNPCPPDRPSAQDVLDGIAALPIGTLLPPLPAVNARSKGWHGEDPMGPDPAASRPETPLSCVSLESDGQSPEVTLRFHEQDDPEMDRLVGDITRCGRASADGRRGAYYVDMSAMDPAGPRPGVVRPASPQWHAQLSSITTRAVSLRARSPVQGDPALGRVSPEAGWVSPPALMGLPAADVRHGSRPSIGSLYAISEECGRGARPSLPGHLPRASEGSVPGWESLRWAHVRGQFEAPQAPTATHVPFAPPPPPRHWPGQEPRAVSHDLPAMERMSLDCPREAAPAMDFAEPVSPAFFGMAPTSVAQSAPPVAPEALSPPAPAIDLDVTGRHSRERSWMGQMQRARQATTDRSAPFAEAPAFQPFAFVAPPAAPDAALRRHAVARRSSKSTIDSPSSASEEDRDDGPRGGISRALFRGSSFARPTEDAGAQGVNVEVARMAPLADAAPGREEALPALAGRRVPVSEASRRVALTSGSDGVLLTPADSPRSAAESPGASRDGGGASSPSLARMPAIAPRSRVHKPASDSPLKSAHRDRPRTLSRSRTATAKVLAEVAGWIPEDAPSPGATTGFVPTPQFGKTPSRRSISLHEMAPTMPSGTPRSSTEDQAMCDERRTSEQSL